MASTSATDTYTNEPLNLETLREWSSKGITTGPLKGRRITFDSIVLSTKPVHWAANPSDKTARNRLRNETKLILEPKCTVEVVSSKGGSLGTTSIAIDLGTAYALTHFLKQEASRLEQSEYDGTFKDAASVLQELTRCAAARLLLEIQSTPGGPGRILEKAMTEEQFSKNDLSLDTLRFNSFGVQDGRLSAVKQISFELTWSQDLLKGCRDHANDLALEQSKAGNEDEFGPWMDDIGKDDAPNEDSWGSWVTERGNAESSSQE